MMTKKLKKEIEGKILAKIQEVITTYDPVIGKKLKKSIENASESIAKKAFKYIAKLEENTSKTTESENSTTEDNIATKLKQTIKKKAKKAK